MTATATCSHRDAITLLQQTYLNSHEDVWAWLDELNRLDDTSARVACAAVGLASAQYIDARLAGTEWLEPPLVEQLPARTRSGIHQWIARCKKSTVHELALDLSHLEQTSQFWADEFGGTANDCSCIIGAMSAAFRVLDETTPLVNTLQADIREVSLLTSDAVRFALLVFPSFPQNLTTLARHVLTLASEVAKPSNSTCALCHLAAPSVA